MRAPWTFPFKLAGTSSFGRADRTNGKPPKISDSLNHRLKQKRFELPRVDVLENELVIVRKLGLCGLGSDCCWLLLAFRQLV